MTLAFTFEAAVRGAESCLTGGRHCCGRGMMSRRLLLLGCRRHVHMFPGGQHLPAEAQGWQNNIASALFSMAEGVNGPFFGFLHS